MGASALFPQIAPEQAFPAVITGVLPPLVGAVVPAALLAAVMSSADTTLLTASTILTADVALISKICGIEYLGLGAFA